jgi:general secretion pathway protein D
MHSRPAQMPDLPALSSTSRARRWTAICTLTLATIALGGCAAQMAYREGKDLVAQGRPEEGMAKYQEAMQQDPRTMEYRTAYVSLRERVINGYLEQGDRHAFAGKWPEAEKMYRRALTLEPQNDRAHDGLRAVEAAQRHQKLLAAALAAWEKKDRCGRRSKTGQHPG